MIPLIRTGRQDQQSGSHGLDLDPLGQLGQQTPARGCVVLAGMHSREVTNPDAVVLWLEQFSGAIQPLCLSSPSPF